MSDKISSSLNRFIFQKNYNKLNENIMENYENIYVGSQN